jgi:hypothetical protein
MQKILGCWLIFSTLITGLAVLTGRGIWWLCRSMNLFEAAGNFGAPCIGMPGQMG